MYYVDSLRPSRGTIFRTYRDHMGNDTTVTWSPDGQRIAIGNSQNSTVHICDLNGASTQTYKSRGGWVYAVAWSPMGQHIASGDASGEIEVRNVRAGFAGSKVCIYQGHNDILRALAFSPDGKRAASASEWEIHIWNATTGDQLFRYQGHRSWTTSLAWSPDGHYIASGACDHTVHVWEATTGKLLSTYTGHTNEVWATAWSPDGTMLASSGADTTVQVWEATTAKMLYLYPRAKRPEYNEDPPETGHSSRVPALAWSPDGQYIASGSWDHTVQVWQPLTGNNGYTHHHTYDVTYLFWFPDSERIASISNEIQIWQAI